MSQSGNKTDTQIANATFIQNCIRIANGHGDQAMLLLNRQAPEMTASLRNILNKGNDSFPAIAVDGTFSVHVSPEGTVTLHTESTGGFNIRCVTGVFFRNIGVSLSLPVHCTQTTQTNRDDLTGGKERNLKIVR